MQRGSTMAGNWKTTLKSGWEDGQSREEDCRLLLFCFAAVFGLGLAAHAYGFLRAGFSHDMLNALVADHVETYWKMQLGRPGIVLYRRIFRGVIAAPWQLGLLSLFWLSLGCFLAAKLFRIQSRVFVAMLAGLLTVNLTTVAMTATYLYEMDADLFAAFLGICAVFLWDRYGWKGALLGVLFVTCCMGTYQSMVSIPLSLTLLLSVCALLRSESSSPVFRKGLRAILMFGLGAALYWLAVRAMCSWKGINLAMDNYNSLDQAVSVSLAGRFLHVYRTWADAFWNPGRAHIEPAVLMVNILLPLLALVMLLVWLIREKSGVKEKLLLCVLLLLLPLAANTAQLSFTRDAHDMMKYAFCSFYLLCLLILFSARSGQRRRVLVRAAAAALALILFCSNIQTANIVYTKKQLEQDAALSLMTRVQYRLEQEPEYIPGETPLVFAGISAQLQEKIPGFEAYYDITGCESASPIVKSLASYNYNAYAAYYRYVLNNPAVMADWKLWNSLQEDETVRQMPCYPDAGCIRMIDGTMVVKLGDSDNAGA